MILSMFGLCLTSKRAEIEREEVDCTRRVGNVDALYSFLEGSEEKSREFEWNSRSSIASGVIKSSHPSSQQFDKKSNVLLEIIFTERSCSPSNG